MDLDDGGPRCPYPSGGPAVAAPPTIKSELRTFYGPLIHDFAARLERLTDADIRAVVVHPEVAPAVHPYPEGAEGWRKEMSGGDSMAADYYWSRQWLAYLAFSSLGRELPAIRGESRSLDAHVWAPVDTKHHYWISNHAVTPIGEYGEEFARSMLQATRVMITLADIAAPTAHRIARGNTRLLRKTMRGCTGVDAGTPMEAFQEGIMSVAATLNMATAERLPGFNDPRALLAAAVRADVPTVLSAVAPPGLVQPSMFAGHALPGLMRAAADGTVSVARTPDLLEARDAYMKAHPDSEFITGKGCPVAADLRVLAQAFQRIHNALAMGEAATPA